MFEPACVRSSRRRVGSGVRRMRLAIALAALAAAASARANTVTEQVIVSSTQATAANPRSTVFTNLLNSGFDVGEDWTISAGASLTLPGQTPAASQAQFGESGSAVTLFTAGADWSVTDQLALGATLDFSPQSTQFAGTPVPLRANRTDGTGEAQVRSQTSQLSGGLDVSWDSFGNSDLEWSFIGGIGFSHYDIDQGFARGKTDTGGALSAQQVQKGITDYCAFHPKRCSTSLLAVVNGVPTPLDFGRFSAGATGTLYRDTDISVFGDWYQYAQDPSKIGFFSLASLGRGPGLPIAPVRYQLRPEVEHRIGSLSARLWLEAGEYVAQTGDSTVGIGARIQYRFTKAFRAWLTLSGQRDVDADHQITRSGSVAGGIGLRW